MGHSLAQLEQLTNKDRSSAEELKPNENRSSTEELLTSEERSNT